LKIVVQITNSFADLRNRA